MASEPGDPMIKEIMEHYEHTDFVDKEGKMRKIVAPDLFTPVFCKHYGWTPGGGKVFLKNNAVIFGADEITNSYNPLLPTVRLYHCNNRSWIPTESWRDPLYRLCRKYGLMHIYKKIEKINPFRG